MNSLAQTPLAAPSEPPAAFAATVWSVLIMSSILVGFWIPYLFRRSIERIERSTQGLRQSRYVKHIQGPASAVILAAVGGYGVNTATEHTGLPGYLGFLLALPVPLAMVTYFGVREVRTTDIQEQWPPGLLRGADRVQIRFVLRRVGEDSGPLQPADPGHVDEALRWLVDQALPAIRLRRDRRLGQWLREHRGQVAVQVVWSLATMVSAIAAVLPDLRHGDWALLRVPALTALAVLPIQVGLVWVRRRHSRYRYDALAEEVETVAGALRRQLTERRLGLR